MSLFQVVDGVCIIPEDAVAIASPDCRVLNRGAQFDTRMSKL